MGDNEWSTIAASADTLADTVASFAATELNYYNSKKLAEYQNELAMQNWNTQNEYNTPSSQMSRYLAAGLNPNLIYGQGSNGNASSAPDAHNVGSYQLAIRKQELFSSILENRMRLQSIQSQKQDNALKAMKTRQENARAFIAEQDYNAIQRFMADKFGTEPVFLRTHGDSSYESYGSSTNSHKELRSSPTYLTLEQKWKNNELSSEKLHQMVMATQNMQSIFNTFHGNFSQMSAGDFFYTILRLLAGATIGNINPNY